MKKHGIIMLLAVLLSIAFVSESFSVEAGRVLAVKKKVYVIRNESRDDAIPKMPLLMKDAVETDAKSRTKLFFTDDSILSLGEKSRVEVEEYLYNSEENKSKSIYKLMDGYLKVVVGRSDLEIHTPTAVAAARGTKFIVVTGGSGASAFTDVIVLSGKVDTWSSIQGIGAGKVTVGAGTSNRIQMSKPPENAKTTQSAVVNQFTAETVIAEIVAEDTGELPAMLVGSNTTTGGSEGGGTGGGDTGGGDTGGGDTPPPPPPPAPAIPPPVAAFTNVTINISFPD